MQNKKKKTSPNWGTVISTLGCEMQLNVREICFVIQSQICQGCRLNTLKSVWCLVETKVDISLCTHPTWPQIWLNPFPSVCNVTSFERQKYSGDPALCSWSYFSIYADCPLEQKGTLLPEELHLLMIMDCRYTNVDHYRLKIYD